MASICSVVWTRMIGDGGPSKNGVALLNGCTKIKLLFFNFVHKNTTFITWVSDKGPSENRNIYRGLSRISLYTLTRCSQELDRLESAIDRESEQREKAMTMLR